LSSVQRLHQHSIGYLGEFYRSKDLSNGIKVLKERRCKSKENPENANNTKYSNTINRHTYNPLVYNNTMG